MAGLALLNAVFPAVLFSWVGNDFVVNGPAYLLALIAAAPVVVSDRRAFEVACRTSAVLLTLHFVPFLFYGGFGFVPSAILLFVAGFAGRGRSRSPIWAVAIGVLAIVISAPWSIAILSSLAADTWLEWIADLLLALLAKVPERSAGAAAG